MSPLDLYKTQGSGRPRSVTLRWNEQPAAALERKVRQSPARPPLKLAVYHPGEREPKGHWSLVLSRVDATTAQRRAARLERLNQTTHVIKSDRPGTHGLLYVWHPAHRLEVSA